MANLNNVAAATTQRVLIFGAPKSGKTQLAGDMSKKYKMIWFDLENGYNTLMKLPPAQKENIELIKLPDTRSYPVAITTMLKVLRGGEHEICDAHGNIGCIKCRSAGAPTVKVNLSTLDSDTIVVIDSLTQLTNSAIANITKNKPDDYKLEYDDWGNLGKLMDICLSHIQQANYNVICISHETEAEMEDGKMRIVPVAGTRNFSRNTAKYFDHVVYCEIKNKKHVAASSTDYSARILTGSRTDVKLEADTEASLEAIFSGAVPVSPVGAQAQTAAANALLSKMAVTGAK